MLTSIRPGKKLGDPTVNQIHALCYKNDGSIDYKLKFSDPWQTLPQRIKTVIPMQLEDLPQLYNEQIEIKPEKYQHLQELKATLKMDYHAFYDDLAH